MKNTVAIFILLVMSLSIKTCSDHKQNSLLGNWASYDTISGYTEISFNSSEVNYISRYTGPGGPQKFIVKDDSLYYQNSYSIRIDFIDDNTLVFSKEESSDTLYRIIKEITTYNRSTMSRMVENWEDSFYPFYEEFINRSIKFKLDHGIITLEELENPKIIHDSIIEFNLGEYEDSKILIDSIIDIKLEDLDK